MHRSEHPLSWSAIARVIIAGVTVYLLWQSVEVLVIMLVSLMLASALYPIVKKLTRFMPLTPASVLVILLLLLPLILIAAMVVPSFISQIPEIADTLTRVIKESTFIPANIKEGLDLTKYTGDAASFAIQHSGTVVGKAGGFLATFLTVIFLTLYLLIDSKRLQKLLLDIIPDEKEARFEALTNDLARINGQYIRGNLIISAICGTVIFIGLTVLNVPYAAPLAIFAALADLLPLVGALIATVPAVIVGFTVSPTVGILVLALFLIYQQIENGVVTPNVYNKALDLSPALSFIAVVVGASLFGVVGAFLSLPIAASIPTLTRYIKENLRATKHSHS